MGVIVDVITPSTGGVTVPGKSTAVDVVRATTGPITTNATKAVVDVVGKNVVGNAIVSATAPTNPYQGLVWIDIS